MDIKLKPKNDEEQKLASSAALASLLNLTVLPVIGFILLLKKYRQSEQDSFARYYCILGIKVNVVAAAVLLLVSLLMIILGGIDSPWTWVYVISYFTLVHTFFILFATWALVRSWSGETLKKS